MRPSKFLSIARRLAERIQNGDYKAGGFPAERSLALDIGVSQMTARKAIKQLIDEGLLSRLPNGRLEAGGPSTASAGVVRGHVALLSPAWNSSETDQWSIALSHVSRRFGYSMRLAHFFHDDDPAILNTVRRFDATFMLPNDPMPEPLAEELIKLKKPLFILNNDWSHRGVPSIRLLPPSFTQRVLDHLASLGHKRIDCLNVQPSLSIIPARIAQWKIWREAHGFDGNLYDEPVEHYSDPLPAAYKLADRLIREGKLSTGALLCATDVAAFGVMRAMADHDIRPGHDVAVCATDGSPLCEYFIPSLTSIDVANPAPFLANCLRWLQDGGGTWEGPLLLQPNDATVTVRQSTVPDIDIMRRPSRLRATKVAQKRK